MNAKERQREYVRRCVQRRRDAGLTTLTVWVPLKDAERFRSLARSFAGGQRECLQALLEVNLDGANLQGADLAGAKRSEVGK